MVGFALPSTVQSFSNSIFLPLLRLLRGCIKLRDDGGSLAVNTSSLFLLLQHKVSASRIKFVNPLDDLRIFKTTSGKDER